MNYQKYPAKYVTTYFFRIDQSYYCNQTTLCTKCVRGYSFNETASVCTRDSHIEPEIKLSKTVQHALLALSLSSSRLTPSFIWLATFYLDDLSYYNYHHADYPQFLQSVFDYVDLANVIRLNPFTLSFFDFVQQVTADTVEKETNFQYWSLFRPYHRSNPTGIYLANSAQDTYKANFLLNALLFLASKTLLFFM